MSEAFTVATIPVPMYGYEEVTLGSEGVSSRLSRIAQALQASSKTNPQNAPLGIATFFRKRRSPFYVKKPQVSAIEWLAFSLSPEPGQPTTTVTGPESLGREYLGAVYEIVLSFSLAAMKAHVIGDLTRPIIVHGSGLAGERADIRTGQWILQCLGRVNRSTDELRHQPLVRVAGNRLVTVDAFLQEVYTLAGHDLQTSTDRVFDSIDRLLCDGSFDVCDLILRLVDVSRLPTALMRSFLTLTTAAKAHLPSREQLFARIRQEMMRQKGPEMTLRIIGRLA
jgi:hypothetical protein